MYILICQHTVTMLRVNRHGVLVINSEHAMGKTTKYYHSSIEPENSRIYFRHYKKRIPLVNLYTAKLFFTSILFKKDRTLVKKIMFSIYTGIF